MLQQNIPTAVILYDLIPLIQRRPYLENPVVETWYENKLDHLRRADLLLAISESSRQEGIRYIGFDPARCVNISTAADAHFEPIPISAERAQAVRERYRLKLPFVMYTGGIDLRKNIEGLISAYASLPPALRLGHQLAIVCSVQPDSRATLEQLCREQGLSADEVVFTGYVSEDDLLALYNLCKVFIFPSWHEGFGLPALEAMSCGRAVIAANASSLPEVVGRDDALFDPRSCGSIAAKLAQVLTDDSFRSELEQHGLQQAQQFSWTESARRAIAAIEQFHAGAALQAPARPRARPRLAYVSPLPPERSGISDYSAELLPELARHYQIDIITPQTTLSDPWTRANCTLRTPEWLQAHAGHYDRVLYHFGNSHFHQHMFGLLDEIPGVVVLHDFFLSGIAAHMDGSAYRPGFWSEALYASHGYPAVYERFAAPDAVDVIYRYPANLPVLRAALGVIVHSENSRRLASAWYGAAGAAGWNVIPHLRWPELSMGRAEARRQLGLHDGDFVVCSFGLLAPTKLNRRLLDAWLGSSLAADPACKLIFVGENEQGEYGAALTSTIDGAGMNERIAITGWADTAVFRQWLAAADAGVQLRALSRGETSGTVLDCMNYGLPTIVNANGSMADLPDDGVLKLADEFDDADLRAALEKLHADVAYRTTLGARARALILDAHAPRRCADAYAQAIEATYRDAVQHAPSLTRALAAIDPPPADVGEWIPLAQALAHSIPQAFFERQLLIDVGAIIAGTRAASEPMGEFGDLRSLLLRPPAGLRVEPVFEDPVHGYCYARHFALELLGCPAALTDERIDYQSGDIFLTAHPGEHSGETASAWIGSLRNYGVDIRYFDEPRGVN
jgi:glycosyltransferase involved in cell wall biosynthesis